MIKVNDYFFGSYVTPQEQRLHAVARNGVEHASAISPTDPQPWQAVTLTIFTDASLPIDRVAAYYTTDGAAPDGARGLAEHGVVALAHEAPAENQSDESDGGIAQRRWLAEIPGQPDGVLVRYRIDAWSSADPSQRWLADVQDPFVAPAPIGREFAYHVDTRRPPSWVADAIVYHVFVDRFAAASDQAPLRAPSSLTEFYGGTLRGVTEKLDYLAGLGINCLWLSPIMDSPTYHGYNPSSYYQVPPRYGTNDDLRELIGAAHARGIRVLLDFVANHTSNEHPAFIEAEQGDPERRAEWYTFAPDYRNGYLTYYDVRWMPVLRTDSAAVREYLIAAARYWMSEFDADGFRLDNVSGPTHAFWTVFQEGVKTTNPEALTLGEVTGSMRDIASYAGRLDACMDFPLAKEMRRTFAQREATLDDLLTMLIQHAADFPKFMARARLLDNHDMHRFLYLAEGDTRRLKLALAFLLVLPGFPVLYYGDEVGLSQRDGPDGQDAYAREPMLWGADQQADLLERARWLITRRRDTDALRRGKIARLTVTVVDGQREQVGALLRWNASEAVILVCNNGETPTDYAIDLATLPTSVQGAVWSAANAWLLGPGDMRLLDTGDTNRLAGTLPPISATLVILRANPHD